MAAYFFDVREAGQLTMDDVGVELPDDRSAKAEAVTAAIDMARDAFIEGARAFQIEVRNGDVPVLSVTLSMRVEPDEPLTWVGAHKPSG